jgi:hypothetical protein
VFVAALIVPLLFAANAHADAVGSNEREDMPRQLEEEPDYLALADAPLFLPRSYLYWGSPVGIDDERESLVFGLEYALHLPIFNNLRPHVLAGKAWAGAVTLSFEGALRMLNTDSKPVRMPSYRPNLSAQTFYVWHRQYPVLLGIRASIFHYSNGQERCAVDEALSDLDPACATALENVRDPSRALNRMSGDFSTNGWLLELNTRFHDVNRKGVAVGHLAFGLGVEANASLGPGKMERPTRNLFGWGRVQGTLEGKKRLGWAAMTLRGAAIYYFDAASSVPSRAGRVEYVLEPYWLTGLGLFARYYGGRDFYNAFFVDRLQQFSAGISWDGERPLKFKRGREPSPKVEIETTAIR